MSKIDEGLDNILEAVQIEMVKVLIEQGHKNTAELIGSLERQVGINTGIILMNRYGIFVNTGVRKDRIPYSRKGRGKTSKYIDGLVEFVKQRGMASGDKAARSIAFAIANTHKKEGMPSKGSRRFSKSGRRTGFIDEALQRADKIIQQEMQNAAAEQVEIILDPLEKNSNVV